MFWTDREPGADPAAGPARYYAEALRHATVAVGNLDECEVATGEREPHAAARALLAAGVELAVVKQGPKGVLAVHRDGSSAEVPPRAGRRRSTASAPATRSAAPSATACWPAGTWSAIMRYANAAGAIVASRLACSSAMPTPAEVDGPRGRRGAMSRAGAGAVAAVAARGRGRRVRRSVVDAGDLARCGPTTPRPSPRPPPAGSAGRCSATAAG